MMNPRIRRIAAVAAGGVLGVGLLAGCSGSSDGSGAKSPQVKASPDTAYLTNLGWTPLDNSLPSFACTDDSYAKAVNDGIKLGVYTAAPYEVVASDGSVSGIDWDINMAVLKYLGIDKVKPVTLQWDGMIPALQSNRIDIISGNIHQTPDRLKTIQFTAPAWYYGSNLMTPKGNPKGLTWASLTDKSIKYGAISGSASQAYLDSVKANVTPFPDANTEFAALEAGHVDALVEDGPKEAEYLVAHANSRLEIASTPDAPPDELTGGYARYGVRKDDCTLNGAYSYALAELRDNGVIPGLLKKYGLDPLDALFIPKYKP